MYAAIDIGGTSTRLATFKSLEHPHINFEKKWTDKHDQRADMNTLFNLISGHCDNLKAIAIGITGDLDENKTKVIDTRWNLEFLNVEIVQIFSKKFNCDVFMDNDAAVAALGVSYFEKKDLENFDYITWGTGIGGASVIRDQRKIISQKLDWFKYFENWEKDCGGRQIFNHYHKSAPDLTDDEWKDVLKNFIKGFKKFKSMRTNKNTILGGGLSLLNKEILENNEFSVTNLGDEVGLYGGAALILNNY